MDVLVTRFGPVLPHLNQDRLSIIDVTMNSEL